jgi:hypothetical protein
VKDTANILNEKGYDYYYYFKEEGIKPETVKLFLCGNLKSI